MNWNDMGYINYCIMQIDQVNLDDDLNLINELDIESLQSLMQTWLETADGRKLRSLKNKYEKIMNIFSTFVLDNKF